MAQPSKRGKVVLGFFVILGFLVICLGAVLYLLTRQVEVEFAQDPNPLESHEANRKLSLLAEAREGKRLGFIRLSEVEINSYLDTAYKDPKNARTNALVRIVKTAVVLHQTNLTFVTWIKMPVPVLGLPLPFVWQRTVSPIKEAAGSGFEVNSMKVGRVEVPKILWPKLREILGRGDDLFDERKKWLSSVPKVALMKNEMSLASELRLYSYQPGEKGAP